MRPSLGLLRRTGWFDGYPEEVLPALADRCRVLRLGRDETLYSPGQPAAAFFVLLDGRLAAWRDAGVESESMLYFMCEQPGTTLCLENVVAQIPYFATMRSLDRDTQVLVVPSAVLDEALRVDPELGLAIARHIARRLQAFTEQLNDLGTLNVTPRVAKYLVTRADPVSGVAALSVSQGDLASRLGTSRQSVSMALAGLAHRRLITSVGRNTYQVDDMDALRTLARDPQPLPIERLC